ncbi:hypothetical protein AMTRI_Chr12g272420 [Amborella trichopoda]
MATKNLFLLQQSPNRLQLHFVNSTISSQKRAAQKCALYLINPNPSLFSHICLLSTKSQSNPKSDNQNLNLKSDRERRAPKSREEKRVRLLGSLSQESTLSALPLDDRSWMALPCENFYVAKSNTEVGCSAPTSKISQKTRSKKEGAIYKERQA